MRVHFVVHESFEAPGAYEQWASARGWDITYSRVYEHEPLSSSADGIDLLVVMGGPQSPATTVQECPHFNAAAEKQLIAQCVQQGAAVVGVCLGSQLIGEALGAPYAHSPQREIGLFPIMLTQAGLNDPLLADFGRGLPVGHWHGDMPGLTADCAVLATSEGCPRQIVRYQPRVYGFQCHLEFTSTTIEPLIDASTDELTRYANLPFVQSPAELRANDYRPMNEVLFGFLDRLVATPAR
ncbi:glutamine amidotransferase [Bifidobacterium goeldii]|uniref:Glutamine amidotransferase n=1 Tax=Bifidobacterium goeldii TaxID=2306975 RepID=A0A430FH23_9BIFI|nr:type 1 glutamine amidotransferase [Bifidobacterium goeldii]RSX52173.1 glutamine amidotransferase [Bifidobacterium goeldii]